MGRRIKQTTCFGDRIDTIFHQIERRARAHNRHIVTDRPYVGELLNWIVPAEHRRFYQDAWKEFGPEIDASSRSAQISLPAELTVGDTTYDATNMKLNFDWRNDKCEEDSECFALPTPLRDNLMFTDDTPKAFLDMLAEWQANAIEWGMVRRVFDWLDDELAPNDFVQACYLMPMLPALVKDSSGCRAIVDAAGRTPKNPMRIELQHLAGLQRTNQILAASELIGDAEHELSSPVAMKMSASKIAKHPLWPDLIDPEYTASY